MTGDRIALDVSLNGHPMGAELKSTADRTIRVRVEALDSIKMIELVRNGRVINRHFPEDIAEKPAPLPGRVKCRLRYGWGPWGELNLGRVCDWDMHLRLAGGEFVNIVPCFQSAPFDEARRDRVRVIDAAHLHLISHTTRDQAFAEDPTKSLILEIDAKRADAALTIELFRPTSQRVTTSLRQLQRDNTVHFTGGFTTESYILSQLVGPSESSAALDWHDRRPDRPRSDWYYVRVLQHNNHMAWSSPIWVG